MSSVDSVDGDNDQAYLLSHVYHMVLGAAGKWT